MAPTKLFFTTHKKTMDADQGKVINCFLVFFLEFPSPPVHFSLLAFPGSLVGVLASLVHGLFANHKQESDCSVGCLDASELIWCVRLARLLCFSCMIALLLFISIFSCSKIFPLENYFRKREPQTDSPYCSFSYFCLLSQLLVLCSHASGLSAAALQLAFLTSFFSIL